MKIIRLIDITYKNVMFFINLYNDVNKFTQGENLLKEVFAIPAVGALIYRIKDNKLNILVQERYKENEIFEKGLLELPAGKIREYEDIFKALKREVEEETGLTIIEIIGENNIDTREMGEYTINSYVPF